MGAGVALAPTAWADDEITGTIKTEGNADVAGTVHLFKKNTDGTYEQIDVDDLNSGELYDSDGTATANGTYKVVATAAGCAYDSGDLVRPGDTTTALSFRVNCDYVPIEPLRVLETRNGGGITKRPASAIKAGPGSITRVQVAGGNEAPATYNEQDTTVPSDVTAVSVTVTGVQSTGNDQFLTVWNCADTVGGVDGLEPDPPVVSNVNLANGDIRPNAVITKVGTGGVDNIDEDKICIFARNETHLVVDINGYFPDKADDNGHIALEANPTRVLDTRPTGGGVTQTNYAGGKPLANQVINVDIGTANEGFILNLTAVDGAGYFTVWDCADAKPDGGVGIEPDPPLVSSLNVEAGIIAANLTVVKPDGDGKVCFYTSSSSHIIADLTGRFPNGSAYTPFGPTRVMETRTSGTTPNGDPIVQIPAGFSKPGANTTKILELGTVPDNTNAVLLNVTGTNSATGFVTVFPCDDTSDPRPLASNLNLVAGQTRPNLVVTRVGASSQEVCIYVQQSTDLVGDIWGYFVSN